MLPSIKTLSAVFGDNAKQARKILEMGRKGLEALPEGADYVRQCYHPPETFVLRLHCLNALARLHGVEAVENRKGEWLEYLNTGDSYAPTLIYWRGAYRITSIGDIAENPRNSF